MDAVRHPLLVTLFTCVIALVSARAAGDELRPRERLLADAGWRFHLGDEWGIGQNLAKAGTGRGPATLDFSDAAPVLYLGQSLDFDALQLANVRRFEGW